MLWIFVSFLFIVFITCIYFININANSPPGPLYFPKLSIMFYTCYKSFILGKKIDQKILFQQLHNDYGEISKFYIGNNRFILLSSFEIISEAYIRNKNKFSYRPRNPGLEIVSNNFKGILLGENYWKQNRSTTLKAFHSLGIGKKEFNELSFNKCEIMTRFIQINCNKKVNIEPIITETFFNLMHIIIFGEEFNKSKTDLIVFCKRIRFLAQTDFTLLQIFWNYRSSSIIRYMFPILEKFEKEVYFIQTYVIEKYKEKIETQSNNKDDEKKSCLLDYYIEGNLDKEEIVQCCVDLLLAGIDTVSSFLSACLILLGKYQTYQKIIQKEIRQIENDFSVVTYEQRRFLPFTQAFIEECHRYFIAVPTFQHRVDEECILRGYLIKPTDTIIGEQYSLNFNKKIWKNPKQFNPHRFINMNNGSFQSKCNLIPFGVGNRTCLGEGIGKTEIFNALLIIISKFSIHLTNETEEKFEEIIEGINGGIIHCPLSHTLLFTEQN